MIVYEEKLEEVRTAGDVLPKPELVHLIGKDDVTRTWQLVWDHNTFALAFDTFDQVLQWCKDFGVKTIIVFSELDAAIEIVMYKMYMPSRSAAVEIIQSQDTKYSDIVKLYTRIFMKD